jgi:hypothetical protein
MEQNRSSALSSHEGNCNGDSPPQKVCDTEVKRTNHGNSKRPSNEGTLNVSASSSSGMSNALLPMPPSSKKRSIKKNGTSARLSNAGPSYREARVLNPNPYFYYIDRSREADDDPLAPLSPALCVPNFVIKLHAILICESLSNVVSWMPHGRSWQILNQVRRSSLTDVRCRSSLLASIFHTSNTV